MISSFDWPSRFARFASSTAPPAARHPDATVRHFQVGVIAQPDIWPVQSREPVHTLLLVGP